MIIAEYKFDSSTDTLPTFNDGFTYTYTDVNNGDGTITRTITSDSSPSSISFSGKTELVSVSYLDISNVTNMSYMFAGCINLAYAKVDDWDTSNVTDMNAMFYNCKNLSSLDVSNFDTINVTNMDKMFYQCQSLTSLDLINFDTSKVTNMYGMFWNCNALTTLDVSSFNTGKVTNMSLMFIGCNNLTSLDVSNFDTGEVTDISYMFYNCESLTSLDVTNFNTSNVTNMSNMFQNCESLTTLDVSNWDTSNVTTMYQMFRLCNNLKYLDISNFKINSNCNTTGMFEVYGIENIGMLHCDNYTINMVAKRLCNDSTIWVQDTKAYEYEDTNNNGVIKFKDYKKQEIRIDLPQPLRSIGNYKDRLYWDEEKSKYCIEQNIGKGNLNDASSVQYIGGWSNDEYYAFNVYFPYNVVSKTGQFEITMISEDFISSTEANAYSNLEYEEFMVCRPGSTIIKLSVSRGDITKDTNYMLNYIKSLNTTFYWVMNDPIVIETDITEKLNFDTYNESMYITTDELEMVPSNISTEIAMKEMPFILSDWSNVGLFDSSGGDNSGFINIDKSNNKIIFLNNRSWWRDSFIEIDTSHLSSVDGKTIKFVFDKPVSYYCGLFKAGAWYGTKQNETGSTELIYTFSDADRISYNSNIFRLQIDYPYDEEITCTIQY